jgi:hypothetical protein
MKIILHCPKGKKACPNDILKPAKRFRITSKALAGASKGHFSASGYYSGYARSSAGTSYYCASATKILRSSTKTYLSATNSRSAASEGLRRCFGGLFGLSGDWATSWQG